MHNEIIRTLGFYQPYGSLMLNGKVETRFVRDGKKPPFPLGKYLIYTTKKEATAQQLMDWSGMEITKKIHLLTDKTTHLNGYAIAIGELYKVDYLKRSDKSFVKHVGFKTEIIKGVEIEKTQWALHFKNVQRIEPFKFDYGKQGVGILSKNEYHKIKLSCQK